jgi:hypothetical protein
MSEQKPLWMLPTQVTFLTVAHDFDDFGRSAFTQHTNTFSNSYKPTYSSGCFNKILSANKSFMMLRDPKCDNPEILVLNNFNCTVVNYKFL